MTEPVYAMVDGGDPHDANFPVDGEGRTFHLGVKRGEIARRILTVGSLQRAEMFSKLLETVEVSRVSARGFGTFTGMYRGRRITIASSNMGYPNMDFFVREMRAVVDNGPVAIIRFGTCGAVGDPSIEPVGKFVLTTEAVCIQQNFDDQTYRISKPVAAHPRILDALRKTFPPGSFLEGGTASADCFYASQGRTERDFDDRNSDILATLLQHQHPRLLNLEMEHFHLLYLAKISKEHRKVFGAAAAVAIAHRRTGEMLPKAEEHALELTAGKACLDALAELDDLLTSTT